MYQEELEKQIEKWEPPCAEVVRCIDSIEDTVERVIKYASTSGNKQEIYSLYRYFTIGDRPDVFVSVDLFEVDADQVIQHLAERL